MTPKSRLKQLLRDQRKQVVGDAALYGFCIAIVVGVGLMRFLSLSYFDAGLVAGGLWLLTFVVFSYQLGLYGLSKKNLTANLDRLNPSLQYSTDLVLRSNKKLNPLEQLQKTRIQTKLLDTGLVLPKSSAHRGWINTGALLFTAAVANGFWLFNASTLTPLLAKKSNHDNPSSDYTMSITVKPPAYTLLPKETYDQGDFEALESSQVTWALETAGEIDSVELRFHDGHSLPLTPNGQRWHSDTWSAKNSVYQVAINGQVSDQDTFSIRTQPDQPPKIVIQQPINAVTRVESSAEIPLKASFSDDFGLKHLALRVTLAQGSGEQVVFREEQHPLVIDRASNKQQTGTAVLDLDELGMEPGSELYFFLEALDNRSDQSNVTSSGTFVVRWPAEGDIDVLPIDTLAMDIFPEYFRSQRQIIIDTEKLIQEKDALTEADFAQRAQDIAIDQKLLRLRYGQFLGEELDSGINLAGSELDQEPDTHFGGDSHDQHDEHDEHDSDEEEEADHLDDHEQEQVVAEEFHFEGDGHDHAEDISPLPSSDQSGYSQAIAAVAHFHDYSEQATLFDPTTRDLLRRALSEMWDSELNLRLANPQQALPFEQRALKYIKEVQQSSRIYLSRIGFKPTPVDFDRRLTGELDDIQSPQITRPALEQQDQEVLRQGFAQLNGANPIKDPEALLFKLKTIIEKNLDTHEDWLEALTALKSLQANTGCDDCRQSLSQALWRQLSRPTTTGRRPAQSRLTQNFMDIPQRPSSPRQP